MKIEVAKPDLETALHVVSIGSASSGGDITTHFVFRHKEATNEIEVLSNNNRIGCSMPIHGCKISLSDGHNAFTVESGRLNKWISATKDAVLTLEFEDGVVKATGPLGSVKFQSMDPAQFSYWDKTMSEATGSLSIGAKRLQAALSHAKLFISDKDTTLPKLAVTEVVNKSLRATDKGALAAVELKDFGLSKFRIHGKDLSQVISFLGQSGDEQVELKEHEKCLFIIRQDGGVLTVGRPPHAFPDIGIDVGAEDPHTWDFRKDDVLSAINSLIAAASKEDKRVNFRLDKEGIIGISMTSAASSKETLYIETQDTKSQPNAHPIPKGGFDIPYPYLLHLLGQWKGDIVRFGINPQVDKGSKSKGGWIRFQEDRDGDAFLTLLVWLQ